MKSIPSLDDSQMAEPRTIYPYNRLSGAIDTLEGESPQKLVAEAGQRVIALRPHIRSYVAAKVAKLSRFATEADEVLISEGRAIGAIALAIAEVAGAGGMQTIGEIARGTSAVVDSLLQKGGWHSTAVRIHLQSLTLASQSQTDEGPAERLMLDRLRIMRKVLGVSE
jgi:hypothetical protein